MSIEEFKAALKERLANLDKCLEDIRCQKTEGQAHPSSCHGNNKGRCPQQLLQHSTERDYNG